MSPKYKEYEDWWKIALAVGFSESCEQACSVAFHGAREIDESERAGPADQRVDWINVKERLPDRWERVVVRFFNVKDPIISYIDMRNFFTAAGEDISYPVWVNTQYQVTHWCPIPK